MLLFGVFVNAQEDCGTDALIQELIQNDPTYLSKLAEKNLDIHGSPNKSMPLEDIYYIPVVVHLLYNDDFSNRTDIHVNQTIDGLNAKLSGETSGIDVGIRLFLTKTDPIGNCTNGINRVFTEDLTLPSLSAAINLAVWNTKKYLNIWVCEETGIFASAFASLGSSGTSSGIVINSQTFNPSSYFSVHELGHYLGLAHIWGLGNGGGNNPDNIDYSECFDFCHQNSQCGYLGDFCCDTDPGPQYPPAFLPPGNFSCENPIVNICKDYVGCFTDEETSNSSFLYPFDNYMAYSNCAELFTDDQKIRMVYHLNEEFTELWSEENLKDRGLGYIGENVSIDTDQTWNVSSTPSNSGIISVNGDLVIESGATLTIESGVSVQFCGNGTLIIKPDAKLKLYGSLSNRFDTPWEGVKVYGDSEKSQVNHVGMPKFHGVLKTYEGAVIENAKLAVQLWGPTKYEGAGGIISSVKTTFRNNERGIEAAPYENFIPFMNHPNYLAEIDYYGWIHDCTFTTDDDFLNQESFDAFIHLTDIKGFKIYGGSFTDSRQVLNSFSIDDYGTGIYSMDGGFNLIPYCNVTSLPCLDYTRTQFDGLGYGVKATASTISNHTFKVKQSDFRNCYVGISNNGISNATILFNDFELGTLHNPNAVTGQIDNVNITSTQIGMLFDGFISGFTFEENEFSGVQGNVNTTIGTLINETGAFSNLIRKNSYTNLTYGNLANNANGQSGIDIGLHYFCNENYNNSGYDFSVPQSDDFVAFFQGINELQLDGSLTRISAGNVFATPSVDFYNIGTDVIYCQDPNGPTNQIISDIPQTVITLSQFAGVENPCAVSYCEPPCRTQTERDQMKSKFYVDGGKEADAISERDQAILTDDFVTADAKDREAVYYKESMNRGAFMVVLHMVTDTTVTTDPDTLNAWMENLDVFEIDLWLGLQAASKGDEVEAQRLVDKAKNRPEATEKQLEEIDNIRPLFSMLKNKSVVELNEEDIKSLRDIRMRKKGFSAHIAKNILTYYGINFPPQIKLDKMGRTKDIFESAPNENTSKSLNVFPNPNNGQFVVHWVSNVKQNKPAILSIFDVTGKLILVKNINPKIDEPIDLSNQTSGIYFYQLSSDNNETIFGKIVVQK